MVSTKCASSGGLDGHRMLRSEEYFVVGPHGDNRQVGTYYPTAETAVEDALDRWSAGLKRTEKSLPSHEPRTGRCRSVVNQ